MEGLLCVDISKGTDGLRQALSGMQAGQGMQRRVFTPSGGCRGTRKDFTEKGREEPSLEAEPAGEERTIPR